jgi:hypothetical protein
MFGLSVGVVGGEKSGEQLLRSALLVNKGGLDQMLEVVQGGVDLLQYLVGVRAHALLLQG